MALTSGTRLGPYEVTAQIGVGGMGEVYRATDTALGRQVAIKVLPDAFAQDAERLARFEREAKTLASLNHPHIAQIYGLERSSGVQALVMELVEGEDLSQRIARGAIPIGDALQIARQIAEALDAAHEKGIVHRDLKPANVKITPQNSVKLLDFGLAKAFAGDTTVDRSNAFTMTAMATHVGVILGTGAYMSPEQARGQPVDRRTDIFAFGSLLYEMLSGRPAFDGGSVSEILAHVIEREPDWTKLPSALHPRIYELLRRCLEKDPQKRRRDIGDVGMEIEHVLSGPSPAAARPAEGASHRTRLAWLVAMVLAVALALAIARPYFSRPAEAPETRLDVSTPDAPDPAAFAISPDGRRLAFVAFRNGQAQLHVRSLDADTAQPLNGTENARLPFWSPDGRSVGFFANGELKRIDIAGGRLQMLAQAVPGQGGTWEAGGTILFAPTQRGPLFRMPASGGEPVAVTRLGAGQSAHMFPLFLPGGRQFLFLAAGTAGTREILLGSLDSTDTTRLTDADTRGAYAPSGWLLFARQGALMAQRFDPARKAISGDPVTVADSVAVGGQGGGFSVSATGVIAYRPGGTTPRQLTWFDRSGKVLDTLGEPDRFDLMNPAISPDGHRVAVQRNVQNNVDIWLIDSARTTRFTSDPSADLYPTWSPDGSQIAFASSQAGGGIYQRASNGAASSDERLARYEQVKFPTDWSADGRFLMYFAVNPKAQPDLWVLSMDGDRKPSLFLGTNFSEIWGRFSPNGRWVVYQSNESGRFEIYVRPFRGPDRQWTVSTSGGVFPRWSPTGNEVYYLAPDGTLMAASVAANGDTLDVSKPVALFRPRIVGGGAFSVGARQPYDVASDGRFLINVALESAPAPITMLMNWNPEAKK